MKNPYLLTRDKETEWSGYAKKRDIIMFMTCIGCFLSSPAHLTSFPHRGKQGMIRLETLRKCYLFSFTVLCAFLDDQYWYVNDLVFPGEFYK